jgi:hypothetical protein
MAIAETPHSIGGGDEVLRISRERERLSWSHRHLRIHSYRTNRHFGSIRLDTCELHHLGPLFGIFNDERAEVGG